MRRVLKALPLAATVATVLGGVLPGLGLLSGCSKESDDLSRFGPKQVTIVASPAATRPTDAAGKLGSSLPHLWTHGADSIYLSWVETAETVHALKYSMITRAGGAWSAPRVIATSSGWFVNWADYPQIATLGGGAMVGCVLRISSESSYSYDIAVMSSPDGAVWQDAGLLHDDSTKTEHGFVSFARDGERMFAAWLDGREMASGSGHDAHETGGGAMTLRAAVLDGSGRKTAEWLLDVRVCECCQTGAAVSAAGPVVVYRDRSETEVRDISFVRLAGDAWTSPRTISDDGWEIDGCPVNGPRIAASGMTVAAAWFTAPAGRPAVKAAFSTDGGATFGPPLIVDSGEVLGRVDVVLTDERTAVVSWIGGGSIRARAVTVDLEPGPLLTIAQLDESRASGLPQMAALPDRLVFAWTDVAGGMVRTAILPY